MSIDIFHKEIAIQAAVIAGRAILEIYNSHFEVTHKLDQSPLTTADLTSNKIILQHLEKTGIPVMSEESDIPEYEVRKHWDRCWIVDPLDGTKEFIKKNGDFTVNIALVERGKPILGIIYIPVSQTLYVGDVEKQQMKKVQLSLDDDPLSIVERTSVYAFAKANKSKKTVRIVASRSHMNAKTKAYMTQLEDSYDEVIVTSRGSSLKFCILAEGLVDVYPRFSPCMEWDVAAGQAICESAGVVTHDLKRGVPSYNKENLYSPAFVFSRL